MASRQTKQSALEEINEILKQGLRPMLDLAPIFAHFEVELQRARDQLALERSVAQQAREHNAKLEARLEETQRQLEVSQGEVRGLHQYAAALELQVKELHEQVADPQGRKRVSSVLELG